MTDPFAETFAQIGEDFETLMPTVPVTVRSINPDTGATVTEVEGVPALKRSRRRQPFGVGGGELGADTCRFVLRYDNLGFVPKARDEIVGSDDVVWVVESVEVIAFQQLAACNVVIER